MLVEQYLQNLNLIKRVKKKKKKEKKESKRANGKREKERNCEKIKFIGKGQNKMNEMDGWGTFEK